MNAVRSVEDAWEGGPQPARGFSLARVGGAKAPRGLKPALPSVFITFGGLQGHADTP